MPVDNRVQFAIVREDPEVELAAITRAEARSALLIASGGCSALTIASARPDVKLTLLDANRAQLDLVERKRGALELHPPGSAARRAAFGVDVDDAASLSGCGNFESLFRTLRAVLDDLVMPAAERAAMLRAGGVDGAPAHVDGARERARDVAVARAALLGNRYWPVAFATCFSDVFLEAMFTKSATQHAAPGSYPAYFRGVVEAALAKPDAHANPWLHHVLLGHWLDGALPAYLERPAPSSFALVHASILDAPSFAAFDVVSLSNLFDWMSADAVAAVAARLNRECRAGTVVVIRQLNNRARVEAALAGFTVDETLSRALLSRDRSMFYERILVLVRNA